MTERTRTTTRDRAPEVPPWLNLDGVIPPELRERIARQLAVGEPLADQVRSWAQETYRVIHDFDAALTAASFHLDQEDTVGRVTGYAALWSMAKAMSDDTTALTECEPDTPEWAS